MVKRIIVMLETISAMRVISLPSKKWALRALGSFKGILISASEAILITILADFPSRAIMGWFLTEVEVEGDMW